VQRRTRIREAPPCCNIGVVIIIGDTGTTHDVVGLVIERVDALVLFTCPTASTVDGVATCGRCDASVRLVGTTNPQQIEVMEFALIKK